jgi:Cdc6-like AAA superfamily ATPase
MDIKSYMLRKRKSINDQSKSIVNYSVFDFNYVPQNPLIREETKQIIDAFLKYDETNIPVNQVIFGSRGSGKTLMIKYLEQLFKEDSSLNIMYANVRYYSTSFKILSHFLNVSSRGLSLSEIYNRFREKYKSKTIIILDEVHLWAPKERQRELLYFLSRDKRNYMILMLSNDPRFLNEIDQSVKSTLQPDLIHFRNYNANEILNILDERTQTGLKKIDEGVNSKIAAFTAKEANSDVRVAIKSLFYWVTQGGNSIEKCFENARRDIYVDLIADLSDTNLLILKAANQIPDKFAKKVHINYIELARRNREQPCSYVHFYNQLSYLQSLGLIMLLSTKVNKTYANRITILCNEKIIHHVYKLRYM